LKRKLTDFLCSRRGCWVNVVFNFEAIEEFLKDNSGCNWSGRFGAVNADNVADLAISALEAV